VRMSMRAVSATGAPTLSRVDGAESRCVIAEVQPIAWVGRYSSGGVSYPGDMGPVPGRSLESSTCRFIGRSLRTCRVPRRVSVRAPTLLRRDCEALELPRIDG